MSLSIVSPMMTMFVTTFRPFAPFLVISCRLDVPMVFYSVCRSGGAFSSPVTISVFLSVSSIVSFASVVFVLFVISVVFLISIVAFSRH